MSERKVYLGDGAYAEFDGYGIVLTTEDGYRATNRIYFEPEVLLEFERFIAQLRAAAAPAPHPGEPEGER